MIKIVNNNPPKPLYHSPKLMELVRGDTLISECGGNLLIMCSPTETLLLNLHGAGIPLIENVNNLGAKYRLCDVLIEVVLK